MRDLSRRVRWNTEGARGGASLVLGRALSRTGGGLSKALPRVA